MLEIRKLQKSFKGLVAVNDVSFNVNEGEIFGLIGPNGAGKTTITNLITKQLVPTAGEVFFMGTNITKMKTHQISKLGIARTFQNIRVFEPLTVFQNVWLGQNNISRSGISSVFNLFSRREKALNQEVQRILEIVGLIEKSNVTARNLSYGDKRRLELARSLASRAKFLILDEPAAGMNHTETDVLISELAEIRTSGITMLMIEHDMKVIMDLCDRIAVINFGLKIAEGKPEEIRSNEDVIEAYLGKEE